MRHSVIYAEAGRYVPLHPELVRACDGNACAALLLAVFDFRAAQEANEFAPSPWVRVSMPWLSEWLGGGFGDRAMKTGLELLVERGFVERRQAQGLDRTYEYRIALQAVIRELRELRPSCYQADDRSDVARASQAVEEPKANNQLQEGSETPPSPALPGFEPAEPQPKGGAEIDDIWAHYVALKKPRHTEITDGERKLIRDALKDAKPDEIKLAITGNFASPFHQGQNDNRKKYNALSQIIKGRHGKEPTRERIDFFIDIAERAGKTLNQVAEAGDTVLTTAQLVATVPQIRRANVNQYVQDILTGKRYPDRSGAVEWAAKAERMMREEFKVQPIFEGEGEDTRIARWERIT